MIQQQSVCIRFKILFSIAIIFLFITIASAKTDEDITFPFDKHILSYSFKADSGEIYGLKAKNMLFFFRIKSKYGCSMDLMNTMIDTKTCEMTIPSTPYSYFFHFCPPHFPNNNYFNGKEFYYQFHKYNEYRKFNKESISFTTYSPIISHCLKGNTQD